MKIFIFLLVTVISISFSNAQNTNQKRLSEIDADISEAVKQENYQAAADLQEEKKIRMELKKALNDQDYTKASELQRLLDSGSTGNSAEISALEKKLEAAINKEDYAQASQIKENIERLKNGESPVPMSGTNTSGEIPEPEFQSQVVYYSQASNKIVELEKDTPELKTSTWAVPGYAKSSSYYLIKDPKSPIRLRNGNDLKFLVKLYAGMDPSDMFRLVKLKQKDDDRVMEYFTASGSGWGSGGASQVSEFDQEIQFDRVREGLYMITTKQPLGPGEYAFAYAGNKIYAFGVDN